jgi:hypothetical protein
MGKDEIFYTPACLSLAKELPNTRWQEVGWKQSHLGQGGKVRKAPVKDRNQILFTHYIDSLLRATPAHYCNDINNK